MSKTRTRHDRRSAPQVAVLVDTATAWGRELTQGINSYANQHGPWQLFVEPRGRNDAMQLPRDWDGDGIIARISNLKLAEDLKKRKLPVVNISGIRLSGPQFSRVTTDYDSVARMAADHFRGRGFSRFAYVGPLGLSYVEAHAAAFQHQLSNQQAESTTSDLATFDYAHESLASQRWMKQRDRLRKWLINLEKPIAIFCWGTSASTQLIHICRGSNIEVPDQVSVLAGDNDDLICSTTIPTMSAVVMPAAQIGFHAARRLERLMQGKSDDRKDERLAPIEIVSRGSTEALAIEDDELLAAVRYLRENVFGELTVQEVADSVPITRRSLERKFRERIGRTPLAEIRRLRIARVKELLATTDLPIPKVAVASGYGTPEYMATVFKSETNQTPLKYRSATRAR